MPPCIKCGAIQGPISLGECSDCQQKHDIPPACFFTEIGGWNRVRTKEFNWYFGRNDGAEEIGSGNTKEQAAKEALEWWDKYSATLAIEGIGQRRNWSINPLMGEDVSDFSAKEPTP